LFSCFHVFLAAGLAAVEEAVAEGSTICLTPDHLLTKHTGASPTAAHFRFSYTTRNAGQV
jgi:hypothetical protein